MPKYHVMFNAKSHGAIGKLQSFYDVIEINAYSNLEDAKDKIRLELINSGYDHVMITNIKEIK